MASNQNRCTVVHQLATARPAVFWLKPLRQHEVLERWITFKRSGRGLGSSSTALADDLQSSKAANQPKRYWLAGTFPDFDRFRNRQQLRADQAADRTFSSVHFNVVCRPRRTPSVRSASRREQAIESWQERLDRGSGPVMAGLLEQKRRLGLTQCGDGHKGNDSARSVKQELGRALMQSPMTLGAGTGRGWRRRPDRSANEQDPICARGDMVRLRAYCLVMARCWSRPTAPAPEPKGLGSRAVSVIATSL